MDVGILYAKPCFPRSHRLHWLSHCALTNILPKDLKSELKSLIDGLNSRFEKDLIVPIDFRIVPGCVATPETIRLIGNEIHQEFVSMFESLGIDDPKIRVCYTVGDIPEKWITGVKSAHEIGNFPCMVKLGRTFDGSEEPGVHKI